MAEEDAQSRGGPDEEMGGGGQGGGGDEAMEGGETPVAEEDAQPREGPDVEMERRVRPERMEAARESPEEVALLMDLAS